MLSGLGDEPYVTFAVTPGTDGSRTWAKVSRVGNGTYALLMGYYGLAHGSLLFAETPSPEVID